MRMLLVRHSRPGNERMTQSTRDRDLLGTYATTESVSPHGYIRRHSEFSTSMNKCVHSNWLSIIHDKLLFLIGP